MVISYASLTAGGQPLADEVLRFLLTDPSSEQVDTFLADPAIRAGFLTTVSGPHFAAVIDSQDALAAVAASQVAMDAVAASQVAMDAVAASQVALAAVIDSQDALAAVAASQVAMNAVAASQVAMTAMFDSLLARSAIFNSAIAEKTLRDSSSAMSFLQANYSTSASLAAAGNSFVVLSSQKVFVIEADTGYASINNSRQARNFVHFQDGVTNSTMTVANNPYPGNPWPLLAGRMMDGLEIVSRSGSTISSTRAATFVVME